MEPVTHMLTGAVLSRTGLNRRARYMTFAMVIGAEFPDIDTLWRLGGPLTAFQHHRGITHTFLGFPFEAALIVGGFVLWHRARKPAQDPRKAPVNWTWLYAGVLLALFSHLLLDWTNNYGVRPFFPFNPAWYAGSIEFIFGPWLFAILLAALLLPEVFALVHHEMGMGRPRFRGQVAAWLAVFAVAALYGLRAVEHADAERVAEDRVPDAIRVFASPTPGDPFRWHTVAGLPDTLQLDTVNTRGNLLTHDGTLYKPAETPAIAEAKRTRLGRIYLSWSMFPVLTETPDTGDPHHALTLVTFADARFMYDVSFMKGREHPPISGSVLLDMAAPAGQRVVETRFDGAVQQ